jgi:hypothetical protein
VNAVPRPHSAELAAADLVCAIANVLAELADLHVQHAELHARYADLIAAGRAALSAARDGEMNPLAYLADELATAHGQHDIDPPRWAVDQ